MMANHQSAMDLYGARRSAMCGFLPWTVAAVLLALITPSNATPRTDAARQLIESTVLVNVLRTDAEQASLLADRLPEELPADLRSQLRRVIDQTLGYDRLEAALVTSVASKLSASTLDLNMRWWASEPGRAITKAESTVYASIFADSSFAAFNPTNQPPQESTSSLVAQLLDSGHLAEFVIDLLQASDTQRWCLLSTVTLASDCPSQDISTNRDGVAERRQDAAARTRDSYSRLPAGDLEAYSAYLRSASAGPTVAALRASLLKIEHDSWENALAQASAAITKYARMTFASTNDAALRQAAADIDAGQQLPRARMTLELIRRAAPSAPAVLVQLARVTLKQAPDLTASDNAPSVPRIDPVSLQLAQRWLDQALELDAGRAETLMLSGHVAYLKMDFKRSVELLERAKAIGTDSPWLPINLGDALWAMAVLQSNHALARPAAGEFEAALNTQLPRAAEQRAVHQLGAIYTELGELQKADAFHRRYVSMMEGRNKAFALHRYAHFLLFYARDVDGSLAAAREAVQITNFRVGREFLVDILAIKGGLLHAAGRPREAAPLFAEARQIKPDLESICPELARLPAMLPGVFGIHAAGLLKDFSGSIGGQTLVYASLYATRSEIEQLLSWGANPNYFDAEEGTALHHAILADNVEAVKVLLRHGANPLAPYVDGRTPSQLADYPSDAKRTEILALVSKAAAGRTSATGPIGTPLKVGYRYRLKKPIDGSQWGHSFTVGEDVVFMAEKCQFTDSTIACLLFKSVPNPSLVRQLALPKDQFSVWQSWFKELGPHGAAGSDR